MVNDCPLYLCSSYLSSELHLDVYLRTFWTSSLVNTSQAFETWCVRTCILAVPFPNHSSTYLSHCNLWHHHMYCPQDGPLSNTLYPTHHQVLPVVISQACPNHSLLYVVLGTTVVQVIITLHTLLTPQWDFQLHPYRHLETRWPFKM